MSRVSNFLTENGRHTRKTQSSFSLRFNSALFLPGGGGKRVGREAEEREKGRMGLKDGEREGGEGKERYYYYGTIVG